MHRVIYSHYKCKTDLYDGCASGISAEEVISECLKVDSNIANELYEILQDEYNNHHDNVVLYDDDLLYTRDYQSTRILDEKWEEIKKSLQCEARFFNNHVKKFFDRIFSNVGLHKTLDGKNAITYIDESVSLFRARVFDSIEKVEFSLQFPEKEFGPPPHKFATSGRMNAQGIPVFYGAMTSETAISEVRPAVGSYVVVATFHPLRTLRVLDISALDNLTPSSDSLFNPDTTDKLAIAAFLKRLSHKLTMPISGSRTDNEYLITQATAEYLSLSDEHSLDGIKFRSTQKAYNSSDKETPYNVVLFTKASSVMNADDPKLEYSVHMYDYDEYGDEPYVSLSPQISRKVFESNRPSFYSIDNKPVDYCLKLDPSSLTIHKITGVDYRYNEHKVKQNEPTTIKENYPIDIIDI